MKPDADFNAVLNAHGLYNSEQFVLRLSPMNHRLVNEANIGDSTTPIKYSPEMLRAFSTYLHETIHWWQHIGSTTGMVLSLCYPNQTHGNLKFLSKWSSQVKPTKSVKSWAMKGELAGATHLSEAQANANIITNNAVDLDFYKLWLMKPGEEQEIYDDTYFESQGHCFRMAYSILLNNLSPDVDPNFEKLPDPRVWEDEFRDLTSRKVMGYYYGSPMFRRKVGVVELFEGQASFCQMQFLAGALGLANLSDFRDLGMLHGVYEQAFLNFLDMAGLDEPASVQDPIVSLFLMICDLSINPVEGFPCDIVDFEQFVHTADPGLRFQILCTAVSKAPQKYRDRLKRLDKAEYDNVSSDLMEDAGLMHPKDGWAQVAYWLEAAPFKQLISERNSCRFSHMNLVQRVIFSNFLSISSDRKKHPEFFCWPGYWMSEGGQETWCRELWMKNLSLFSDQEDNGGIFIREFPNADKNDLEQTLNLFFGNNLFYNLTRQWIIEDGPFSYGFNWLSEDFGEQDWRATADRLFQSQYGLNISDISY